MDDAQLKKYFSNDEVFKRISKMFLTLEEDDRKRCNIYLNAVIDILQKEMCRADPLFSKMFKTFGFCGSFYKGTKVGEPNEFDINMVLRLPFKSTDIHLCSNKPAFAKITINGKPNINLSREEEKTLNKFIRNGYIDNRKFQSWIESIFSKIKYELPEELTIESNINISKTRKSGPAFTLILQTIKGTICIDLAPALSFSTYKVDGVSIDIDKLSNCKQKEWFLIALPIENDNEHWRYSFFYQENEILAANGAVKPVIRLMKKFRDRQDWRSIASYFIETLFLNKLNQTKLTAISNTWCFFLMLQEMLNAFSTCEIGYYWDERHNLLQKIGSFEMNNMRGRLNNIIKDIRKNASNPYIIAKHVLNNNELEKLVSPRIPRIIQTPQESDETVSNWRCIIQ